ncbi:hypothetical protein Lal_00017624 [Lupinus albus]|uniref:Putative transcription factor MYB-HB-like family n=1 Tax=Lupinus albus TaxID=3870 RepID=A0A6A4QQ77_LUPAL|nr:putative transcription factor MYB-HB-like family [Lupinus albus]KAF1870044.1 hypothetical protein Lal_00017624 [Lupinus albus]
MGRAPCCSKVGLHKGPWTPREDALLNKYIQVHGEGQWKSLPQKAGLLRCGKSCRLRWMNYLRPNIKRGNITPEEDDLIIRMHSLLGNRWSLIAGRLQGRTDNEIKNYWNTYLSKKQRDRGTNSNTHKKLIEPTKKKSGGKKKNKLMNDKNQSTKVQEQEKTIVYVPKPIRLTSLSSSIPLNDSILSLDSNAASVSTSQGEKEINVRENEGFGFFDENHDGVNGSDEKLVELFEEYLELFNMEKSQDGLYSFAESLLV